MKETSPRFLYPPLAPPPQRMCSHYIGAFYFSPNQFLSSILPLCIMHSLGIELALFCFFSLLLLSPSFFFFFFFSLLCNLLPPPALRESFKKNAIDCKRCPRFLFNLLFFLWAFFFLTKSNFSFHCLNGSTAPSALQDCNIVFPAPDFVFCLVNPFCMAPSDRCVDKDTLCTKTSLWPEHWKGRQLVKCTMMDFRWSWNGLNLIQSIWHQGRRRFAIYV